jgi:lysyl-tRNA synthetase class 2
LIDKDLRYRRRYADLIVHPHIRNIFIQRSRIIKSIRDFLDSHGFLEVETPILQPLYGGGIARPFLTHHNTLDMDLYLRIADELYLKRLIIGGFEKVWEFCKDFRNEGMDRLHNPEFSMVELYWAYADYNDIMDLFEELLRKVVSDLHGKLKINYCGHDCETLEEFEKKKAANLIGGDLTFEGVEIDFEPGFKRISMVDAIKEQTGLNLLELDYKGACQKAQEFGIDTTRLTNWGKVVEAFFETSVEETLIQPTFITDFPHEISPLAKVHRDNPRLTERFELFIGSLEMGNAFSELNDPVDQLDRFQAQTKARQEGDEEAHQLDEDFIRALQYGMPPTGGLGFGIDRLVMLLTNNYSIQEVILFPQMRPEGDVHQENIVNDMLHRDENN